MSESACNSPLLARALARKMADVGVTGSPARSIGRNSIDGGVCNSPARSLGRHSVDSAGSSPAVSRRSIGGSAGSSPAHRSYVDSDLEDECTSFFTEERLNPDLTVIGDWVKFRDNKRWKQRWGVVTKISPAADCLHLQLYRDSKDRYRQGQTKASLSLQHFLGVESGFTLDKESNTIAIICQDVTVILAFDTRERLIQWQVKISNNLGEDQQFLIQIKNVPSKSKIATGPARLHVQDHRFSLTSGVPPRLMGFWEIALLRRYGIVEGMFCFEGGSRCGKGEGLHVCVSDQADEITQTFKMAALGKLATRRRPTATRKTSGLDSPRKQLHSRADTRNSDLSCVDTFLASSTMQTRSVCGDPMNRSMCSDDGAFCACVGDLHDASSRHQSSDDLLCPCRTHRGRNSPFWPSTDSTTGHHGNSELDSNYGCGDTVSVSELHEHYNNTDSHWPHDSTSSTATFERRPGLSALERCASCISKLGAPSMSRSSTATHAVTPGTPFSPAWTMEPVATAPAQPPALQWAADAQPCHHARSNAGSSCDRMSLSSHGSAGSSGNSEYSVPRFLDACRVDCQQPGMTPLHQHPPNIPPKSPKTPLPLAPSRPPKPSALAVDSPLKKRAKKPPMPLPPAPTVAPPAAGVCTCSAPHRADPKQLVGPYENYDVPKTLLGQPFKKDEQDGSQRLSTAGSSSTDEYYDTPRNVKECLAAADGPYGNYDTPPAVKMLRKPCGCIVKLTKKGVQVTEEEETVPGNECPCQRVMCWAENWMMLPYCRRGNGMENTSVPIHKIKLSGEGKMPVVNPSGEIAIYATVDKTKKLNRRSQQSASESQPIAEPDTNYENVEPEVEVQHSDACDGNYQNIDFAQSLEYYENSKDILQRAGISQQDIEKMAGEFTDESNVSYSVNNGVKFCNKCGHSCHLAEGKPSESNEDDPEEIQRLVQSVDASKNKQDDYLLMEPQKKPMSHSSCAEVNGSASKNHPGYIPMSPLTKASSEHQSRLSSKAASIPSLAGPFVDRSRKRGDFERVPGSAMMTTRPYLRRTLDGDFARKRSSSADSSRYLEDLDEVDRTAASSPKLTEPTATEPDKSDRSLDGSRETITAEANPAPAVHIRRSSSVPCKSGNRDSSSSNDSGVSTGSLKHRGADFAEFELPLTTSLSARRHHAANGAMAGSGCVHGSLPRRSKSVDPMRELTFRFQKINVPAKSSSAEGEVPVCSAKREGSKGFAGTGSETATVAPYLDSRSTSSGTSDMSDYIETLSLSSHESSDTQDSLRLMRPATTTLRPRSGKEYQLIDRSIIETDALKTPVPSQNGEDKSSTAAQLRSLAPALFSAALAPTEKTETAAVAATNFVRSSHVESQ